MAFIRLQCARIGWCTAFWEATQTERGTYLSLDGLPLQRKKAHIKKIQSHNFFLQNDRCLSMIMNMRCKPVPPLHIPRYPNPTQRINPTHFPGLP